MPRHTSPKLYAVASNSANARFFDDLVRCETRLYNAVGDRLRDRHGIVTSQFELLRYVRDHPRSRVAEIAATFVAGVGAISKSVDRLETRGWVTRFQNPDDRRSSLISLTSSGESLVAEAQGTFNDALDDLLSPALSAGQVGEASAILTRLRQVLEQTRAGLPVGLPALGF